MKLYKVTINDLDDTGIDRISFVLEPAVDSNFFAFSKEEPKQLQFFDESQHIVTGVVMRADYPIVRYDSDGNEYYVLFEKETIKKMVEKCSKYMTFNIIDVNHDESQTVDGAYLIQSYIIDREAGIDPQMFSDIEDGSWIASYKVENLALWKMIQDGEVKGFSLSGLFQLIEEPSSVDMSREKKQPEWARSKPWDKDKKKTVTDIQHNDKEIVNSLIESLADGNISIDEFSDKIYNVL